MSKSILTDRETQILASAWHCFKTQPEVDMVKLAAMVGMTNPRSATNAMAVIKKKLRDLSTAEDNPASPAKSDAGTPSAGKKAGGVKSKASEEIKGEQLDSPTKSARQTKTSKAKGAGVNVDQASKDSENSSRRGVRTRSTSVAAEAERRAKRPKTKMTSIKVEMEEEEEEV